MKLKNRLPEAKTVHSVVEWRYPKAHRFWDDCGKLISAIEHTFPGLACQALKPEGFVFEGKSRGVTGAIFYWDKASVLQVGKGDAGLPESAPAFWAVVSKGLSVSKTTRLGHRSYLLYETDSTEMAVKWLDGFEFWRLVPEAQGFGHPKAGGSVLRTRLEPGGRTARIEINAGSIGLGAGRKEGTGVIVDVDIVIETPDAIPDDVRPLLEDNLKYLRNVVQPFFRTK